MVETAHVIIGNGDRRRHRRRGLCGRRSRCALTMVADGSHPAFYLARASKIFWVGSFTGGTTLGAPANFYQEQPHRFLHGRVLALNPSNTRFACQRESAAISTSSSWPQAPPAAR